MPWLAPTHQAHDRSRLQVLAILVLLGGHHPAHERLQHAVIASQGPLRTVRLIIVQGDQGQAPLQLLADDAGGFQGGDGLGSDA